MSLTVESPSPSNVVPAPVVNTKPDPTYEMEEFREGPFKSFKFAVPSFSSVEAISAKYGNKLIVELVNAAVSARIRTKVKNDLGVAGKTKLEIDKIATEQLNKHPDGILFTAQQASEWKPEVRELTPTQMFRKATELLQQYPVLLSKGQVEEAQKAMLEATSLMQQAQAKAQEEAAQLATTVNQ